MVAQRALPTSSVAKINGNRRVPYLNRNNAKRNLNLNNWDGNWNANYRFLAVRNDFNFSRGLLVRGSFVFHLFAPATKHSSYLTEVLGKMDISLWF